MFTLYIMYPFNIYIYQYVIYNILKQCIYSSEVIFTSSPDFGAIIPFYFKYFLTQQLQRSMARYKHKRNVLMWNANNIKMLNLT